MKFISKKNTLFFSIVFIFIFIFYAYFIKTNKGALNLLKSDNTNLDKAVSTVKETKFLNVEYKFTDQNNKAFITKSQEASFNNQKPDLILLFNVYSFTKTKDGSQLEVRSKEATYDKVNKNITYKKKVSINNKDYEIICDTAEYDSKNNLIFLNGNIIAKNKKNLIRSEMAKINLITNDVEMSMIKKNDQVYGKKEN